MERGTLGVRRGDWVVKSELYCMRLQDEKELCTACNNFVEILNQLVPETIIE